METIEILYMAAGFITGFGLGGLTALKYLQRKIQKQMEGAFGDMAQMFNPEQEQEEGMFSQ